MLKYIVASISVLILSCGNSTENTPASDHAGDSVSTAPLTDSADYNPREEADSAAKQMNLDPPRSTDSAE
jgi:hypothetical protein